uniref:hypothetical protein n=1 Tax=Devosia sp. TaxID=1871048 RepID=UPI002FC852FA
MFYSAATRGFYNPAIHVSMPDDVVEISDELYADLLAGESAGQRIVAAGNGVPILIDPPAATAEHIWPQIKAERDRRKALGVLAAGNWYHSDADSRIQQLGLVLMG